MKIKIFTLVILLLLGFGASAQVNGGFTDDFSDGDFTANPQWTGETTKFQVNGGELQLNDSEASTAMLSTECHAIDGAEWTFKVRYGFNPSTNNFCDVYIVSDNANPFSCTAGYFVRVCGVSTTDNVCLYRKNSSTSTKIIDGRGLTLGTNNTFKIKVTRSADGEWKLYTDVNDEGTYTQEGETTDLTYSASRYFGLACKYTVSNAAKMWFDDISVSGTYTVDTEPPALVSARFTSENSILLSFDEEIDEESVSATNFNMDNGIGQATSATLQEGDARKIVLQFAGSFTSGTTYTLTYGGISDGEGNTTTTTTTQMTFVEAGTGSVVINEIMADPTPVVGLPESEYIELYNNSPDAINLEGWSLKIGTTSKTLDAYMLYPSEYVVICRTGNDTLFYDITNILPLSLSATALTNGGTTITLYNEFMSEVDKITYSSAWYRDVNKKDGGWSLERIDPNNRCEQSTNGRASENENGGTPGVQNSIFGQNVDETAPSIVDLSINSANELHITFSETIDTTVSLSLDNFSLDNDYGNPVYAGLDANNPNLLVLMFGMSFEQNRIYNLTVENITDLCGNVMERQTVQFSTVPIAFNTIVVSEIMSKPSPVVGLPDAKYVEIYNRSDNAVSLSGWKIALGSTTKALPSVIINAKSYLVLTSADN
ncbi:MAG: lamin tail domain-containing protein, partial [Bacteroidales bacterium]|nr:lamin tail domain-containing protein [Bacteroidales bacterium]